MAFSTLAFNSFLESGKLKTSSMIKLAFHFNVLSLGVEKTLPCMLSVKSYTKTRIYTPAHKKLMRRSFVLIERRAAKKLGQFCRYQVPFQGKIEQLSSTSHCDTAVISLKLSPSSLPLTKRSEKMEVKVSYTSGLNALKQSNFLLDSAQS